MGLFDDIIGASFLVNEVIAFVGRGDKYRTKLLNFTIKKKARQGTRHWILNLMFKHKTNISFIQQPKQLGTWEHFEGKSGQKHELLILGLRLKNHITFC
jgi:hypothetical protein